MAICEVCGRDVAPIDVVARGFLAEPHYFCSPDHANQWDEAQRATQKAPVPVPEAAEDVISEASPGFESSSAKNSSSMTSATSRWATPWVHPGQ